MDTPVLAPAPATVPASVTPYDAGLTFDNAFARLPDAFYTRLGPTPLPEPYLVAKSERAAALLGLAA